MSKERKRKGHQNPQNSVGDFEEERDLTEKSTAEQMPGIELTEGGFTDDTEVLTTDGPRAVSDLTIGTVVYALDPVTELCKLKPITSIQQVAPPAELINIQTRRSNLRVAPDHRIPFQTDSVGETRFQRACELHEKSIYRFINGWRQRPGYRLEGVDITNLVTDYEIRVWSEDHGHTFRAALPDGCDPIRQNSHTGYYFDPETFKQYQPAIESIADDVSLVAGPNARGRPYRFDGDDFIEFIGWFATEGNVYWPQSSDTAQVQIAQENTTHRETIAGLLKRMGLQGSVDSRSFEFSSTVFGTLFESLCGVGSQQKRLPALVWQTDQRQRQLLFETLMAGDGNDRGVYYTSSAQLASDMMRLCIELGIKPQYARRDQMWRLSTNCVNDGFKPDQNVRWIDASADLYRMTVADYGLVLAGRDGKFQWVGVSGVS
ncbi:hypothetical protein [Halorientalis pallida]|uniref:DOD-type homing endonuclease domain-containing protein n=1 Tax=Halorientalis pallida TaxID=2479928 RepID=A0A498KWN1_9EURY|nr:hypothetical protein [Halorientalis pallida]RXK47007.1 hypothetical protein EAF64_17870 [Halorientalis pallida]